MKHRNRRVYLEFQIGNKKAGQVIIELFNEIVPKAAENFEELCTGNRGIGRETGQPLCYAGCKVTKIMPGQFLQCGDFEFNNGRGGESVFGGPFEDENFNLWHGCAGIVSMHNTGVDSNRSQFYITFKAMPTLNRRHVIVGQVRKGMEIVRAIEKLPTNDQYVPRIPVFVSGSGIFEVAKTVDPSQVVGDIAASEVVVETAAEKGLKLLHNLMADNSGEHELYNSENIAAADGSAARRKSGATRARELFELTQGCNSAKHVQRLQALTEKKTAFKGTAYSVWNEASVLNRYDKSVDKMRRTGQAPRLIAKTKRSRQTDRSSRTNEDVTYINYRNKLFNKKLEKAYGSFVVDIRQNLERGTAI